MTQDLFSPVDPTRLADGPQDCSAEAPPGHEDARRAHGVSRRAVMGGGLVLAFSMLGPGRIVHAQPSAGGPDAEGAVFPGSTAAFQPNGFISVDGDGSVTLVVPSVEMGQGIRQGEATLLAEELEVDLAQVQVVDAPPNVELYKNRLMGLQATGGSTSTMAWWAPLSQAGAAARVMLVTAAANGWGVPVGECVARSGTVLHPPSGRSVPYGALAAAAARLPVPAGVQPKTPEQFRLIGQSLPRVDTPAKAKGTAVYGMDVQIPGMKVAAVAACPVFGGKLVSVDDRKARTMAGVVDVLKIKDAVCVVADSYWNAAVALSALVLTWDTNGYQDISTSRIMDSLKKSVKEDPRIDGYRLGDIDKGFSDASTTIEADYISPFLAHATMEPMNCTVHVRSDGCDIWVGTQVPHRAQQIAMNLTGLPADRITVHNHVMGGGFGRRLFGDIFEQAVSFAKQVPYPLKVMWSREEDIQHDRYRPAYYDVMKAGLNADGTIGVFTQHVVSASVSDVFLPGGIPEGQVDPDVVEGAKDNSYDFPHQLITWTRSTPRVPIGWWRGVGAGHNAFIYESFIDECAHKAGMDPVDYRLRMIKSKPRARAVLETVASKSGWGGSLPKGSGRGVAISKAFNGFIACVAQVSVADHGEVKVEKCWVAVDCGLMINPNTVTAQVEGGLIFGLSAALYSEITFSGGHVDQQNFNDYRVMRIQEAPVIETYLIKNQEPSGGIGEFATVIAPPALANAIFAATGKRLRRLPVDRTLLGGKN